MLVQKFRYKKALLCEAKKYNPNNNIIRKRTFGTTIQRLEELLRELRILERVRYQDRRAFEKDKQLGRAISNDDMRAKTSGTICLEWLPLVPSRPSTKIKT